MKTPTKKPSALPKMKKPDTVFSEKPALVIEESKQFMYATLMTPANFKIKNSLITNPVSVSDIPGLPTGTLVYRIEFEPLNGAPGLLQTVAIAIPSIMSGTQLIHVEAFITPTNRKGTTILHKGTNEDKDFNKK